MQGFLILLFTVLIMYSYAATSATKTYHVELMHGKELSIMLPSGAVKLEFDSQKVTQTSPNVDKSRKDVLWSISSPTKRGKVIIKNKKREFVINSVTYDDLGNYSVLNTENKKLSIHSVKVTGKRGAKGCVAGETFSIPLSGLVKDDATLQFINQAFNLTLVDHGSPVGNSLPDYMGRIQVTTNSIELLNVNVSDVGNYTVRDHLNRRVMVISMYLVDHHTRVNRNPLLALLLLLGIPLCACCCCRKKICKKTSQPTTTTNVMHDNQMSPCGAPPVYTDCPTPAGPTQGYTPGYSAVGESIVHPPPNPTFPPQPPYSGYPATSPAMPPNPGYTPGYPAVGERIVHPPPNPTFPPQPPYSGYPASAPAMPPNPAFNPAYPSVPGFPPAQPSQWSGAL